MTLLGMFIPEDVQKYSHISPRMKFIWHLLRQRDVTTLNEEDCLPTNLTGEFRLK